MPKFYQPLELGSFKFNDYRKEREYSSSLDNLDSEFVLLLKKLNLVPTKILVLWRPKDSVINQHSDGEIYRPNWARLNYIHGGPGLNKWWVPPPGTPIPETPPGTFPYKRWVTDELIHQEDAVISGFNIVNIGQPHGVADIKDERWAVSIELSLNGNQFIDFDTLSNIFQKYHR